MTDVGLLRSDWYTLWVTRPPFELASSPFAAFAVKRLVQAIETDLTGES
jgi:hypothetical protein